MLQSRNGHPPACRFETSPMQLGGERCEVAVETAIRLLAGLKLSSGPAAFHRATCRNGPGPACRLETAL